VLALTASALGGERSVDHGDVAVQRSMVGQADSGTPRASMGRRHPLSFEGIEAPEHKAPS